MKRCFFITPIGAPETETRKKSDYLLNIIKSLLEAYDYEVVRADQFGRPGSLTHQTVRLVIDSELAIADITENNPNAFYELGIRHSTGKPTILIADSKLFAINRTAEYSQESNQKNSEASRGIPFDIMQQKTLRYTISGSDVTIPEDSIDEFKEELKKQIKYIYSYIDDITNPVSQFNYFKPLEVNPSSIDNSILSIINSLTKSYFILRIDKRMRKLSSESFYVLRDVASIIVNDIKDKIENLIFEGVVETAGLLNNRIHNKVIDSLMHEFKAVSVNDLSFWETEEGQSYQDRILHRAKVEADFVRERIFIIQDIRKLRQDDEDDYFDKVIKKQVLEDKMAIRIVMQKDVTRLAQISEMDFALLDTTAVSFFRFDEGRTYKIDFRRPQLEKYSSLYKEISNRSIKFEIGDNKLKSIIETEEDLKGMQKQIKAIILMQDSRSSKNGRNNSPKPTPTNE